MRLIDAEKIDNYLGEYADEWYESEEEHGGDFMDGYCWTLNRLQDEKRFPTVDAVPVIRCKDCRYWWKDARLCTHEKTCDGNITFKICCLECDADFYCGYGEEK